MAKFKFGGGKTPFSKKQKKTKQQYNEVWDDEDEYYEDELDEDELDEDEYYEDELDDDEYYEDEYYEDELDESPSGYKNKSEEERIEDQFNRNYEIQNHDEGFSEFDENYSLEGDLDLGDIVDEFDERTQNREYTETKWYEKTLNVFIAAVVVTIVVVFIWGFAGDYILDFMGIGQEYVEKQDIGGRLDRYQNEVIDQVEQIINPDDVIEEESRVEVKEVEEVPVVIGPGLYRIGQDIHVGQYFIQKGTKLKKYAGEFEFVNDQPMDQDYGANTIDNLTEGMYVDLLEGAMTLNSDRPKTDVMVNQTVVLEGGNHYVVGIDLPAGYYKIISASYQKKVKLTIGGIIEGQEAKVDIKRQNYVKLAKGNLVQVDGMSLFTRVPMEFIY